MLIYSGGMDMYPVWDSKLWTGDQYRGIKEENQGIRDCREFIVQ